MAKRIRISEIQEDQQIPFVGMQNGSKTLIKICPVIRRSRIRKVYIQIKDRKNQDILYVIKNSKPGWNGIDFNGLILSKVNGIEDPHIWRTFFCTDHKTHSIELYVPTGSTKIYFNTGLGAFQINWK